MQTNTPRYRRMPDLDRLGAAWEELATGAIRYTLPEYDLNAEEARQADALLALPAEERAAVILERHAATAAARDAAGPDVDMLRVVLRREALGEGLEALRVVYLGRETPGAELAEIGEAEVYRLGGLDLEIEAHPNPRGRRVYTIWPSGQQDSGRTPTELLQLINVLGRPEVVLALARWANQDSDAKRRDGLAVEGRKGGRL